MERIIVAGEELSRATCNSSASALNARVCFPESVDDRDAPAALFAVWCEKCGGAPVMVAGGVCSRSVRNRGVKINAA